MQNDTVKKDEETNTSTRCSRNTTQRLPLKSINTPIQSMKIASEFWKEPGVHSVIRLGAAGFQYTGDGDTAQCKDCELEVSNWTVDMNPFNIHSQRKPDCPFIRSITTSVLSKVHLTTTIQNTSSLHEQENPSKRQKIETIGSEPSLNTVLQRAQRRTFSHWSHRTVLSSAQMMEAGFFNCNVGDRVICIYCNLICQQWTQHTDDPCEVHKTLSPNCIYVKAKLNRPAAIHSTTTNYLDTSQSNEIILPNACNPTYSEVSKRHASFTTWPNENLPSVDDLVRAGFFYTGTKTIVTCFYCNGSLQNWGANDNPMIEHARWFPHCAYAKQLCGDDLYRKIQESKRAQLEHPSANELKEKAASSGTLNTNLITNSRQLLAPDESTLSRLVAARLDLPISQRLLDQNFKLSIIKQCWEDQLRLKQDDFVCEYDLYMACLILQKQIEHIDGKKENIVIPNIKMKQIREQNSVRFKEEREITIKREKSFISWSHPLLSRIDMLCNGWQLELTKKRNCTICPHCHVKYQDWRSGDNPSTIHHLLTSFCPFLAAPQPMHPGSVPIEQLSDVFTPEKMADSITQPILLLILPSRSGYAIPQSRSETFSKFPGGPPNNTDALVASGFYYEGISTLLTCYNCGGNVNDFHQYPSNEIDTKHYERFPHCRFAQLLLERDVKTFANNDSLCGWCSINPTELIIHPCMHLAVCHSCTSLINTCPKCGIEAEFFFKIYK